MSLFICIIHERVGVNKLSHSQHDLLAIGSVGYTIWLEWQLEHLHEAEPRSVVLVDFQLVHDPDAAVEKLSIDANR